MSVSLTDAKRLVVIYGAIPVFVGGVIGGTLNTLVLLSLRTFRQNSCSFYLTVMSMLNLGQLCTGLLSHITNALLNRDGTETSLFYCKFRPYTFQICVVSSLTSFSLATIDQYCATCSNLRWKTICHIKTAHRLVIGTIIFWSLHGIPYLIYFEHIPSSDSNKMICISRNFIFGQYRIYAIFLLFSGFVPILICVSFGLMAYFNVQQISYRTVPLVRRELDKQLTVMVLVQVLFNTLTLSPYVIVSALTINPNLTNDPTIRDNLQLATNITLIIYYLYFAVSPKNVILLNLMKMYLLESILYLYMGIRTISSTVPSRPIEDWNHSMETTDRLYQSSATRCIKRMTTIYSISFFLHISCRITN